MVFAYPEEIDAWLDNEGGTDATSAFPEKKQQAIPTEENSSAKTVQSPVFLRRRTILITGCCLLIIGLGGWLIRPRKTTGLRVVSIKQLTDDGHVKGNLQTDGTKLYFNMVEGARAVLASAPMSGSPVRIIDTPFSNVALMDLSKDGKSLLVFPYEGIGIEGPLWTMPSQGGPPHRVGEAVCNYAKWSPDDSIIACVHGTTITLMNADGSNTRTAAAFSLPVGKVVWSPDGQRLRFALHQTSAHTTSLWEIGVTETGNPSQARPLGLGASCCNDWAWTSEGKNFVYTEIDAAGKSHLKIQTSGPASHVYELPLNIGTLWTAVPGSADSLFLMISSAYRGELLKFDTRQKTLQSYLPGVSAAFVAYSPDAHWITYINTQDNTLWRSRVDGSEPLQLIRPPMEVEVSSWSPDGKNIAVMARAPGKLWRIYLIDREGGPLRQAAEGNDSQGGPSWSPDGKFIVYGNVDCQQTQNCSIRRLELASGKTEVMQGSGGLRTARWAPDGQYVAALSLLTHELMLFDLRKQYWRVLASSITGDNVHWSNDSQYIYVDSLREAQPIIERVRVNDGRREAVVNLNSLQKASGTINGWFGLTPDNMPILSRIFTSSEVYEFKWAEQ
ncbi:MAG TPA: hypothetical protein VGK22_18515 [Candidatus Angelobacter sp.]